MIEQHPENLSKLQATFKKLVWSGSVPKESPEYLKESAPIDWQTRVGIYQYAVKERILESLDDDFEETKKAMGAKNFRSAMEAYLKVYPSKYASLAEVSKDVPKFLKEFPETKSKKYLSELASLEWELLKASLSENLTVNNLADLQKEENQSRDIVFILHNSVQLFECEFPVQKYLEEKVKSIFAKRTFLVVFQNERKGSCEEVEKDEFLLLQQIAKKQSLSKLNQFIEENAIPPEKLGEYFSKWTTLGWIVGFHSEDVCLKKSQW